MTQLDAADYANMVYSVFSFQFCAEFLADLLELPVADFVIISISEFLGILAFLIVRAECYRGRLIAYAGDNATVASWIMHRKPRNRLFQYLVRVLNRLGSQYGFSVPP